MNYSEGSDYMLNLSNNTGRFSPYTGIIINYPGYKGKLNVSNGTPPTHSNISLKLYNLINYGTFKKFLN